MLRAAMLAAIALWTAATDVSAEMYFRNARSGREVLLLRHVAVDEECRQLAANPQVRLVERPRNGTVAVRLAIGRSERGFSDSRCISTALTGIGVFYRSKPGYVGADQVRTRVVFPSSGITIENTIVIDVRQ